MRVLLINAKAELVQAIDSLPNVEAVAPRKCPASLPTAADGRLSCGHGREPGTTELVYAGGAKISLSAIRQVRKLITATRPDVVHAFYARPLTHAAMAMTGLRHRPRLVAFRGITAPLARLNPGDWISYWHPSVDAIACESAAVRDVLVRCGIPAVRCHVTYNTMLHPPSQQLGREALVQFGIPSDAFVVATIANMRPVKGIDILIRAAIECADLVDTHWLVFGRGNDRLVQELAQDPRIRHRVHLAGFHREASDLVRSADLFVMPSRAEALSQALLEAMYQGVCPVVSDAGGMKEAVRHGQDGLVVPRENVAALAAAIRTLHADRRLATQYGASAQARVTAEFTPAKVADRTLAIYEQVLGNARTTPLAA